MWLAITPNSGPVIERLLGLVTAQPTNELAHQRLWVNGNHEHGLLGNVGDGHFNAAALIALEQLRRDLPASVIAGLAATPDRITCTLADQLTATLVHASPVDPPGLTPNAYLENAGDAALAAPAWDSQLCLVGHTHYPRIFIEGAQPPVGERTWQVIDVFEDQLPGGFYAYGDERLILNPGSVGQPRDSDPRASYALLNTAEHSITVRRVAYPIAETQRRLRAWLPNAPTSLIDGKGGLATRLERGL